MFDPKESRRLSAESTLNYSGSVKKIFCLVEDVSRRIGGFATSVYY